MHSGHRRIHKFFYFRGFFSEIIPHFVGCFAPHTLLLPGGSTLHAPDPFGLSQQQENLFEWKNIKHLSVFIIKKNCESTRRWNKIFSYISRKFSLVSKEEKVKVYYPSAHTEKTNNLFPFKLNGIWSWSQFSFRFWTKWNSIWSKIERKTVTLNCQTVQIRYLNCLL